MTIDLTPDAEEFEYEGHECYVSYSGIAPRFKIDDENISVSTIEDVIGRHAGRSMEEWKESLKQYIDETEV